MTTKRLIIGVFWTLTLSATNGQEMNRVLSLEKWSEFIIVNEDTFSIASDLSTKFSTKKLIFKNNTPLDSTRLSCSGLKLLPNGTVVGKSTREQVITIRDSAIPLSIKLSQNERIQSDFETLYVVDYLGIKELDLENYQGGATLINMTKVFCGDIPCKDDHEMIGNITRLHKDHFLIEGCISSDIGPGCETKRYYLVNSSTNSVINVTQKLSVFADQTCKEKFEINVVAKNIKEDVFKININKLDDICRKPIKRTFLFNREMNYLSEVLPFGRDDYGLQGPTVGGSAFKNSKLVLRYYYSKLDDHTNVLVPYNLNLYLERCMYKAFNDQQLTNVDLANLNSLELDILRHSLYAKHNAMFNDTYYQAYFNLFAFYNSQTKILSRSRIDKIVLSGTDETNLRLIESKKK